MFFTKKDSKITIALIILIIILLYYNLKTSFTTLFTTLFKESSLLNDSSLLNNILQSNNTKIKNDINNKRELFNNSSLKGNEIIYGMNPNCLSPQTDNETYCPNQHPNIPCSKIGCNPATNPHLTDDMKRDIYMYVYLSGLLEVNDIWNKDTDEFWYNSKWNTPTTT